MIIITNSINIQFNETISCENEKLSFRPTLKELLNRHDFWQTY